MIDYETFARIRYLHDHKGLEPSQIARELGHDPRTVSKWLEEKQFCARTTTNRPSKLDPFKDTVFRMIEFHDYTARQIFQRLREDGYSGSYSSVKKYVRKVQPRRKKAFLTLAVAP